MNLIRARLLPLALLAIPCGAAEAHTGERAFVLLLPTELYMAGGVAVVALSFAAIALAPAGALRALARARWRIGRLPRWGTWPSLAVLFVAIGLTAAGYLGSRDPLANPLPPSVWALWWVGFTFLSAVLGNLWTWLNPWRGIYRVLTLLPGLRDWRRRPPLRYRRWLAYWPATIAFFAFAWFELVYPAPQDPARLAGAVALYLGATLALMLLFGDRAWLRYGEAFSVFFRIVARLSPLDARPAGGACALSARPPGIGLLRMGTLPPSGVAFVLLALAAVSFDGLSRTFWWLDLVGANPLEPPGRTGLMWANSAGLLGLYGALAALYLAAVLLGRALAGHGRGAGNLGRFVASIVPIAFGYHFAHYMPAFLIDAQYAVRALSDPWALGWNLLGTREMHVTSSFLANHDSVRVIWNIQAAGIVAAHVMAVAVAHLIALSDAGSHRQAVLSQAPMTALMIGYTWFGLWLLATPAAG